MPIDPITVSVAGYLLHEAAQGFGEGLSTGFVESLTNNSSAIVQQTKEQAQLIQAQSQYLQRREEREARLESIQIAQLELQSQIAFNQAQRDERRLQLKQEELQLQQQDLEDRRELARLQRELMRELHAETVKVKMTEIQTIWDSDNWFSKLSRQETEDIFRKGQQEYRLLVLASPPDISEDCPDSFRNNLKIEIQNRSRDFLETNYPLSSEAGNFSSCPVEFYGDYFKEPISHIRVKKQLHKLLAPIPTLVLYSEISDYEVNFHLAYWGLYDDEVSSVSMQAWNWEEVQEELKEAGFDEKKSLRIIRQIIVMIHKLSAAFVADLYYLYIDSTASYEPRLFDLEEEFDQELFPQELLRDYIETLQQVQQRQRDVYEQKLKKMKEIMDWSFTLSFTGFDDDLYKLVGISFDGSKLVGERDDGKITKVWNLLTGKLIGTFDSFHFKGLSPDGQILYRNNFEFWRDFSVTYLTLRRFLREELQKLNSVILCHANLNISLFKMLLSSIPFFENKQLLIDLSEFDVKKYFIEKSDLYQMLARHSVNCVVFSTDGQFVASGNGKNTITLWDLQTREPLDIPALSSVSSIAFSADGQLLASGSGDNTIKLWHPHAGQLLGTLQGHSGSVTSVGFSSDGQLLASGSLDGTIKLWHPHTGELLRTLERCSSVYSVAFSTDGRVLASGSHDKTIKLWHPHTGELLRTLEGHSDNVTSVAFSTDGRVLASGSHDKTIKLWHPHTGELLRTLEEHSDDVTSVAFSTDGRVLASGSHDKTIKLWHPHTGELLRTLEGHSDIVTSVAFSPNAQLLASGSHDETIKLWYPHALNSPPADCEFPVTSPDRSLLVKPNYNETTETWNLEIIDAATDKLLETLPGHSGSIEQVIFSEDGNTMVSLGGDLVIKVWRRGDG